MGALLLLVLGGVGYLALVNRAGDEEEQAHDLPAAEPSEQAGETVSDEGDEADGAVSADDGVAVLEDEAASPPEEPAVETDEEPVAAPEAPPAREPAADPPPPPSEPVPISPDEARAVADSYLQAGAGASSADVSEMYADRVNYYRRGTVSRAAVMEDKSYYFRQWPERSYERLSDVVVEQTAEGAKLRFNYAFEVEGGERGVRGEGWTELTFRREGEALRIVGENGGVRSRRTF